MNNDIYFMKEALKEAKKAYLKKEIPVGAVIVYQDKIIARAYNTRMSEKQVFTHAEIKAINKACKKLNSWVLEDCTIYVTLEPCLMCTGALLQSRIKRIVYATTEPKHGVIESIDNVLDNPKFNHHIEITSGVLKEESSTLLKKFFHELRQNK
ncbi:MAG: tRNA adenosine(34) deaminase TadA [Bacilli bacterium]|nr:tRNA adenosine(34) deaminase TadA [Bacilli bacterium]